MNPATQPINTPQRFQRILRLVARGRSSTNEATDCIQCSRMAYDDERPSPNYGSFDEDIGGACPRFMLHVLSQSSISPHLDIAAPTALPSTAPPDCTVVSYRVESIDPIPTSRTANPTQDLSVQSRPMHPPCTYYPPPPQRNQPPPTHCKPYPKYRMRGQCRAEWSNPPTTHAQVKSSQPNQQNQSPVSYSVENLTIDPLSNATRP